MNRGAVPTKTLEMVEQFKRRMSTVDPATNVKATHLLDTNVMIEIYSLVDMMRLADELGTPEAARRSPKFSYRQDRTRDSVVLAWWLAKQRAIVGVLGAEVVKMMEILVPDPKPGEDASSYLFTVSVVHVVREFALRDLSIGALTDVNHEANGTSADTELLKQAKEKALPLITWEGVTDAGISNDPRKLRNRAKAGGVEVYSPTEFLTHHKVDVRDEARRFVFACTKAVREARSKRVISRDDVLDSIVPMYSFVLLDEVSDALAHVPRG